MGIPSGKRPNAEPSPQVYLGEFIMTRKQSDHYKTMITEVPKINKKVLCEYCGTYHNEDKEKCNNCGANLN